MMTRENTPESCVFSSLVFLYFCSPVLIPFVLLSCLFICESGRKDSESRMDLFSGVFFFFSYITPLRFTICEHKQIICLGGMIEKVREREKSYGDPTFFVDYPLVCIDLFCLTFF